MSSSTTTLKHANKKDFQHLYNLMRSADMLTSKEAMLILRDMINNGDLNCLNFLIDRFMHSNDDGESSSAVDDLSDLICSTREPLDNVVWDRLNECTRNVTTRQLSLTLFTHIIVKQPPWFNRLSSQSTFLRQFLKQLRVSDNVSFVVGGLFCLSALLFTFPYATDNLNEYFTVFLSATELYVAKQNLDSKTRIHLQLALFTLFQRLYALYPCNFLRFLRFSFSVTNKNSLNRVIFDQAIKPMLNCVKLHYLLIISSKEEELSKERWQKKERHDIMAESNQVNFEFFEQSTACDGNNSGAQNFDASATGLFGIFPQSKPNFNDGITLFSHHSHLPHLLNIGPLLNVKASAVPTSKEVLEDCSPSVVVGLSTPPMCRSPASSIFNFSGTSAFVRSSRSASFGANVVKKRGGKINFSPKDSKGPKRSFGQKLGRFFSKSETNEFKNGSRKFLTTPNEKLDYYSSNDDLFGVIMTTSSDNFSDFQVDSNNADEVAEEATEINEENTKAVFSGDSRLDKRLNLYEFSPKIADHVTSEDEEVRVLMTRFGKSERQIYEPNCERDASRSFVTPAIEDTSSRQSSALNIGQCCTDQKHLKDDHANTEISKSREPNFNTPSFLLDLKRDHSLTVPRLSSSHSVGEFLKRINWLRFISNEENKQFYEKVKRIEKSIPVRETTDENNVDKMNDDDTTTMIRQNFPDQTTFILENESVNSLPVRAKSCPCLLLDALNDTYGRIRTSYPVDSRNHQANIMLDVSPAILDGDTSVPLICNELAATPVESSPGFSHSKMIFAQQKDDKNRYLISKISNVSQRFTTCFDGLDDYLLVSRLRHDYGISKKQEKLLTSDECDEQSLRISATLLQHQTFYERHKRLLYHERSRRLYGRLKLLISIEEQNDALREQIRLQEVEIQHLIRALSDIRKANVAIKNGFVAKESALHHNLNELQQQKVKLEEQLKIQSSECSITEDKYRYVLEELEDTKHKLFNTSSQLEKIDTELNSATIHHTKSGTPSPDLFVIAKETLILADVVRGLKLRLDFCRANHENNISFLQNQLQERVQDLKRENHDLKKTARREKIRAELSICKLTDFEQQLRAKHELVCDMKRQLQDVNETHREHLQALQMKFKALQSVCQRQEIHILELYSDLETKLTETVSSETADSVIRSKTSKSPARQQKAKSRQYASPSKSVQIPSRQGAREIVSYDSDGHGYGASSSAGSENWFLPLLFEKQHASGSRRRGNSATFDRDTGHSS